MGMIFHEQGVGQQVRAAVWSLSLRVDHHREPQDFLYTAQRVRSWQCLM